MNNDLIEVRVFLDAMTPLLEAAERSEAMLRRRLGTAFRIAAYSVGGYEVPLNKIIADLLDPRGAHGQEGTFLKLFLAQVTPNLQIGAFREWRIVPSHRTQGGRYVDLAIFRHQDVAIYMESKPWAEEGYEQLEDYARDLLGLSHEQKRLLFLPGTRRESTTLTSETKLLLGNRFQIIPFQRWGDGQSIVQWLEQCAGACEADNVRMFVGDLSKYLDAEFPLELEGRPMSNDSSATVLMDAVLKNKNYMRLVLRFEQIAPQLRHTIAVSFIDELVDTLKAKMSDWDVENSFRSVKDSLEEGLLVRKKSWPSWGVRLEMTKSRDFMIGFWCPSKVNHLAESGLDPRTPLATENDRAEIANVLRAPLLSINQTVATSNPYWPAYCYLPSPFRNWEGETFLLLAGLENMPDGRSTLGTFADWFKILGDVVAHKVEDILTRHAQGET